MVIAHRRGKSGYIETVEVTHFSAHSDRPQNLKRGPDIHTSAKLQSAGICVPVRVLESVAKPLAAFKKSVAAAKGKPRTECPLRAEVHTEGRSRIESGQAGRRVRIDGTDRVAWPGCCRNLKPELRVSSGKPMREIELKDFAVADLHRDRRDGSCAVIGYELDAEH